MAHPYPSLVSDIALKPAVAKAPSRPVTGSYEPLTWPVLGAVGLVFFIVGMTDVALAWFPFAAGTPEWEFGTVSATLNGLPVPMLGLALLGAAAVHAGSRWRQVVVGTIAVLVVVFLASCALLYALNIPVALGAVEEPVIRTGLMKGMLKAGVATAAYAGFAGWLAWRMLQAPRSR